MVLQFTTLFIALCFSLIFNNYWMDNGSKDGDVCLMSFWVKGCQMHLALKLLAHIE